MNTLLLTTPLWLTTLELISVKSRYDVRPICCLCLCPWWSGLSNDCVMRDFDCAMNSVDVNPFWIWIDAAVVQLNTSGVFKRQSGCTQRDFCFIQLSKHKKIKIFGHNLKPKNRLLNAKLTTASVLWSLVWIVLRCLVTCGLMNSDILDQMDFGSTKSPSLEFSWSVNLQF